MTDYTPTGKPDDLTRYDARALRREFDLIALGVNSKSDLGSDSTVSTTSMLVESPATKTFTAETGKDFAPGQTVYIADAAAPATNNMTGVLASYARDTTGIMVVNVTSHNGSGTKSDWVIGVSNQSGVTLGSNTFTGAQNFSRATVASHATTADIWLASGNQIDFTGTATITDFPDAPQAGAERTLICAGTCSFVASANMEIDGVQSGGILNCAAKDIVMVRATATNSFRLSITRYSGENGGANNQTSAVDITLTAASSRLQIIGMTASNKRVNLPDATTVGAGSPVYTIKNNGLYIFALFKNDGGFICYVRPGQVIALSCSDVSTAAGVWEVLGAGVSNVYVGNTANVVNAVDSRVVAVALLSPTKAVAAYRNNSTGFLTVVVFNSDGTAGSPVVVNGESSNGISVAAQTATQATVVYRTSTGVTKGYVLDISGNVPTPGTVRQIDATTGGDGTALVALSSTQLLLGYQDGGNYERVLTISSSTISEGAETTAEATLGNNDSVELGLISASKVLYACRGNSPADILLRLQSITAGVPAPTGSVLRLATAFTDTNLMYRVTVLSSNRAVVCQPVPGQLGGDVIVSLLDVSGTTPILLSNRLIRVGALDTLVAIASTRLSDSRLYLEWAGGAGLGVDALIVTVGSDDRMFVSEITESVETGVTAARDYIDCVAFDSTKVLSVCRNASTYFSGKVLEVAS